MAKSNVVFFRCDEQLVTLIRAEMERLKEAEPGAEITLSAAVRNLIVRGARTRPVERRVITAG